MDRELARRGSGSSDQSHVKLKKELGLLEGVAVILGIIIGSGTSDVTDVTRCDVV